MAGKTKFFGKVKQFGGSGSGLSTVATDETITGDGAVATPLSAIGVKRYTVETGETFTIPANHQFDILGRFEINGGILEIEGRMEIG